jgi:hypothetical protein
VRADLFSENKLMRSLLLVACLASAHAFSLGRRDQKLAFVAPHPSEAQRGAPRAAPLAMVIPGDSMAEVIVVDGGLNFLGLYQGLITLRILLSWFPQAQSVELLRPLFTVSDV